MVDVAAGGQDGCHLARENQYDLILLDVGVPGTDGWRVLHDKLRSFDLGADDYLVKPTPQPRSRAADRNSAPFQKKGPDRFCPVIDSNSANHSSE